MGWLDKLLGREKKPAGDMTGDSSMKSEGMQEQDMPSSGMPSSPEQPPQEEQPPPSGTP